MKSFQWLLAPLAMAGTPALAQVMTPAEYVSAAGSSDLFEQQSAQLVLQSTKDPAIRSFAQMMMADHGKSMAAVKAAASAARVAMGRPAVTPLQSELLAELRAESGRTRDAAYIAQQKAAHGQALAVQTAYAMEGREPHLKAAAAGIVPAVERHVAALKTM